MKLLDTKYFGIKLSPHRIKNDKGQLIVTGCTFARTGKQRYHKSELGINEDGFIDIDRPVEEVSSPATVASFEGAPLTYDHPEDDVKVGVNWDNLAKGMAFNVKYVSDSDKEGHLVADLIFTDPQVIDDVENKRINELSAGYNCEVDEENWIQRKIRGNHIAIVESARAGHIATIRDKKYSSKKAPLYIRVGDKKYKIVDTYSYVILNDKGKKERYTDLLAYNEEGEKEAVKTIKNNYSKQDLINALKNAYGFTNKECMEWIKRASEKSKMLVVEGFKNQAKRYLYED